MRGAVALSGLVLIGAAPPPSPDARLRAIVEPVSAARMKATVEKLVSFGTRHTLSSQTDPKRGIGAALDWTQGEFRALGLPTERPCDSFTGDRIPKPTRVCDMVAIQHGTERPNDVVIITGHIDSRVSDPLDAVKDAPGANDDGSGSAAVLEAARILSKHKFPGTIVYSLDSGEEQGLYGAKVIAAYARAQGWNVIANLNNDIIGNSLGSDGVRDDTHVRIFSEGPRWQGHEELAKQIRSFGGENDSPSRNISRFLDRLADRLNIGLDVRQVWRNDRFGRGGDHTEFLNLGFPAVRFTVAVENYNWQHQDLRVEKGIKYGDMIENMDFPYLAKVTKLNVAALAAIASAPPPPEPKVEGAVSTDTKLTWNTMRFLRDMPADHYVVRWRRTDSNQWEHSREIGPRHPGDCTIALIRNKQTGERSGESYCEAVLNGIRVDDWVFGVSSVSKDGFESPVASAVPGGAFKPWVAPPPAAPK
ncbi:MAG TPA: M28 family peptidase [Sphingomicrobium sp.]|nr:M28 family peptidase [Sphingomicrobium sp.]